MAKSKAGQVSSRSQRPPHSQHSLQPRPPAQLRHQSHSGHPLSTGAKVALIAPYPELGAMAQEVADQLDLSIEVLVGVLRIGVALAREMEAKGVEVLITRGGTIIEALESGVKIPIVQIEVTGYDVLRALYEARSLSHSIGLVDYQNIVSVSASEIIEDLLKAEIHRAVIHRHSEIEEKVCEMRDQGIEIVVGGAKVVEICNALGIPSVLIRSERASVERAMMDAMAVLKARKLEREKANQLKAIVEFAHEGIISTDTKGRITAFNVAAARATGVETDKALNFHIEDLLPGMNVEDVVKTGSPQVGLLYHGKNAHLVCNKVPIKTVGDVVAGVVITLQDTTRIQQLEGKIRKELAARGHVVKYSFDNILGESKKIREAIDTAKRYSQVDSTVLILGETGTGKELFAQGIHRASRRKDATFVAVNCAALPETLLESELFGYVEGAFTDARRGGKPGLVELAHGGTLFLDEIGEVSPRVQARLLRVLQEKEVMRVGDDKVIPVDIRVIVATNRDLWAMVEAGKFREDLYYRINVLALTVPPLRERKEDLSLLVAYFLRHFSGKCGGRQIKMETGALKALCEYEWPGNVRELMNIIERLVVLTESGAITQERVHRVIFEFGDRYTREAMSLSSQSGLFSNVPGRSSDKPADYRSTEPIGHFTRGGALRRIQKDVMLEVLKQEGYNRARAAKRLGISTTTIWRWLKDIGV